MWGGEDGNKICREYYLQKITDMVLGRERVKDHLACFGACDCQPHLPLEDTSLQHSQLPGCMACA